MYFHKKIVPGQIINSKQYDCRFNYHSLGTICNSDGKCQLCGDYTCPFLIVIIISVIFGSLFIIIEIISVYFIYFMIKKFKNQIPLERVYVL